MGRGRWEVARRRRVEIVDDGCSSRRFMLFVVLAKKVIVLRFSRGVG